MKHTYVLGRSEAYTVVFCAGTGFVLTAPRLLSLWPQTHKSASPLKILEIQGKHFW